MAILTVGSTRRTAARYVGCSPSTICRTAQRDAQFAKELRAATEVVELNCLQYIQNAAKKEQYWRAAAWALERRLPERYAARPADSVALEEVREVLSELARTLCREVPSARHRKPALKRLLRLIREFRAFHKKHRKKTRA